MPGPSSRMLRLLSLLQVQRHWPGDVLTERLGVSARTLRRDVERLRELDYRIESTPGPGGGYRMTNGTTMPPLLFDDEQAVAVALALAVAPASGADVAEAATRALATLRHLMPERLRPRLDAVEIAAPAGTTLVDPDVLVAVSDAARRRQMLVFDYIAGGTDGPRSSRRVAPHAVVAHDGRWYLLAWDDAARGGDIAEGRDGDSDAGDWRTFRIDRMHPGGPTHRSFTPRAVPGGDPAQFVAALFRGSRSGSAWPCVGSAIVDLPARRLRPFVDRDSRVTTLAEERSAVEMGSWSWHALAARFAGFGARFEILEPDELRDAAIEVAQRLSAASETPRDHGRAAVANARTDDSRLI